MSDLPIIDSHIHLYTEAELSTLAWYDKPGQPLEGERTVSHYDADATGPAPAPALRGFILVESDRKSDLAEAGWEAPLAEVEWFARVATGRHREGEDRVDGAAERCLAIIPWAPVPAGPAALEKYVGEARRAAGEEAWRKVKGFRYLLQDKPAGTMLAEGFVEGVKYLGREGYVFELGVDSHRRGKKQLAEAIELISRAHDDVPEGEKVTFIINHMCKPNLEIYNLADPAYTNWRTAIYTLSRCDKTYMQLSGGLSEMTPSLRNRPADDVFEAIHPWLGILLATFGPERLIFGSDWPACTPGVAGSDAWGKWLGVVRRMCDLASLGEDKMRMLYAGTAIEAFKLDV